MITRSICALAVVLLLAACGGGGGGSGPVTGTSEPPSPLTALSTDQDKSIAAGIAASTARPAFGSVTQSSNKNAAGVSTDSAQSSFDGDTYTLRIARRNGSTLSLNTDDHLIEGDTTPSGVTGREQTGGFLLDYDARSITIAGGAVEFDPGYGGWMSRGYWIHLTGNWAKGEASRVEVGAFVDGPEFSGPVNVPVSGTATYDGAASGLFVVKAPTASSGIARDTGFYEGTFRLTADFSSNLVSGEIRSHVVSSYLSLGDGTTSSRTAVDDSRIALGSASINTDGSFAGTDVTLTSSNVVRQDPSEGYWGGRFSTIDDSTGNPRAVAGTHGVTMDLSDGHTMSYVGYHFGVTDDF